MAFTLTIVAMVIVLALCWRFLGAYMVAVYVGSREVAEMAGTADLPGVEG